MRKINTYYDPPPIPTNAFDWHAYSDDYDGAPDSSRRGWVGHGPTKIAALEDLGNICIDDDPEMYDSIQFVIRMVQAEELQRP